MDEKINGRTPEEIKRWVDGRATCNTCPKEHEVGCEDGERTEDCQMTIDTITYIERLEATLDRLGDFGKLFADYTGCPRGATGRAALPIEEEVLAMKPIRDVDNGEWIPVNADALRELVAKYKQLRDAVPVVHARWIDEIEPNAVTSSGREVHFYRCSACGFQWNNKTAVFHYFKFCPNCGARMDAEEDSNGHQND